MENFWNVKTKRKNNNTINKLDLEGFKGAFDKARD